MKLLVLLFFIVEFLFNAMSTLSGNFVSSPREIGEERQEL